eukprot:UN00640
MVLQVIAHDITYIISHFNTKASKCNLTSCHFLFSQLLPKTSTIIMIKTPLLLPINRDNSDENPFIQNFSYYGSNPAALKDIHIHMYFFCVRRC